MGHGDPFADSRRGSESRSGFLAAEPRPEAKRASETTSAEDFSQMVATERPPGRAQAAGFVPSRWHERRDLATAVMTDRP